MRGCLKILCNDKQKQSWDKVICTDFLLWITISFVPQVHIIDCTKREIILLIKIEIFNMIWVKFITCNISYINSPTSDLLNTWHTLADMQNTKHAKSLLSFIFPKLLSPLWIKQSNYTSQTKHLTCHWVSNALRALSDIGRLQAAHLGRKAAE